MSSKKKNRKDRSANYRNKVIQKAQPLLQDDKMKDAFLVVFHDDWCGIFKGSACNCNPDVGPVKEGHGFK
jgi:hypothetical protein